MSVFNAEKVITPCICEQGFCAYSVGFDLDDNGEMQYRWKSLTNTIVSALVDFCFGLHAGESTPNSEIVNRLCEAAQSIYRIKCFEDVKNIYNEGGVIEDDIDDTFLRRGEFGELILHVLLRDFHNTIPLLSKIYFKDTDGATVHGFDAVHIEPQTKTLWLGESKLYIKGQNGVNALIKDLKEHFKSNYMEREFALVSKKVKITNYENTEVHQNKEYWINLINESTTLSEKLSSIVIPMLCTYESKIYDEYNKDDEDTFKEQLECELKSLNEQFKNNNKHPWKDHLNIILLLFPVKHKATLVKNLHKKLISLKGIYE